MLSSRFHVLQLPAKCNCEIPSHCPLHTKAYVLHSELLGMSCNSPVNYFMKSFLCIFAACPHFCSPVENNFLDFGILQDLFHYKKMMLSCTASKPLSSHEIVAAKRQHLFRPSAIFNRKQ